MATRVFLTKVFVRFAVRENISAEALRQAVLRADRGLIDANLGGGVIKQRVARTGSGKSGGYRTIILYRLASKAIFVYGFAKKDRANIDDRELREYRDSGRMMLSYDDLAVAEMLLSGKWREITNDDQDLS